jgi:hypothetical protein
MKNKTAEQKVAQNIAISLGEFLFSKNKNELPKVAQLAKNSLIWSSWDLSTF